MSVTDLFSLAGKTALVTGGSRGLGRQIAEGLAEMGARVAITARKQAELDAAQAAFGHRGHALATFVCDLQDTAVIPDLVDRVLATFGSLDLLVNNAGASWGAPAEDYPASAWHKVMNLNVNAVFLLTQEVARRVMIPRRAGRILNVASVAGLGGNHADTDVYTIAYNTSKAAVVNLTRALAVEWGRYGIAVNALCPGWFPSKMTHELLKRNEASFLKHIPLGRFGGGEDLKGAAVFLLSDAARHITGQYLAVDGGESA